mmetsp:Transcript_76196/g.176777  ORF Transcript_76196/g.176777 Transcript_76196/m.176777 type:complete len:195 (-) Transcript_76196:80-664(-)
MDSRGLLERCILVPYEASMVPTYHQWMLDPELLELTGSEPLSLEEEFQMQASWHEDPDKLSFILLDRALPGDPSLGDAGEGGALAGDVNVFFNTPDAEAGVYARGEIEVMIAEHASRRCGIAQEAVELMMKYCEEELATSAFVAKIKEHNKPSISLFEKLGFRFIKHVPVFGEVVYEFRSQPIRGGCDPLIIGE